MFRYFSLLPILALAWPLGIARADQLAVGARLATQQHEGAVVTVRLVLKQSSSGPGMDTEEHEYPLEAIGTVIDPHGLTVVTLSTTDPSSEPTDADDTGDEEGIQSRISNVEIVLPSGRELDAEMVIRDNDEDIALVRPRKTPSKPLSFVDLSKAVNVGQFDPVVILSRLGKLAGRACSGSVSRVLAVVKKPIPFYVLGDEGYDDIGSPAFTLTGRPIGIVVQRTMDYGDEGPMRLTDGDNAGTLPVILPGKDVVDLAKQARGGN